MRDIHCATAGGRPISEHSADEHRIAMVSFVDLAPTVLSIAGIKSPGEYQGFAFLGKYINKNERESGNIISKNISWK